MMKGTCQRKSADKECLENGEIEDYMNQQSNVYVTKQEQLRKTDAYHNLKWKQLKDK